MYLKRSLLLLTLSFTIPLVCHANPCAIFISPLQTQTSAWISLDMALTPAAATGENTFFSCSPFMPHANTVSRNSVSPVLMPHHNSYFVTVHNEQEVCFNVSYYDPYHNKASSGYPQVTFWSHDTSTTTVSLDCTGIENDAYTYTSIITLSPGTYYYYYCAQNSELPQAYTTPVSSFVVTSRPPGVTASPSSEMQRTSNAQLTLQWEPNEHVQRDFSYFLYLGTDPQALPCVYTGVQASYTLYHLEYKTQYYWYVETKNAYGITAQSPLYSFTTHSKPAHTLTYPNPFNPARGEHATILFDMKEQGNAEITMYSEFGDSCWETIVHNLLPGAHTVLYDGRDNHGKLMYNGSYICVVKRKYFSGKSERDSCRILIIK